MYLVTLDQAFLENHKKQTGIEGSWSSYFDLLKQALDQKSLSLCESKEGQGGELALVLKIHYPLMAGARISGSIKFSTRD